MKLLEKVEERIKNTNTSLGSHMWFVFSAYTVLCHIDSLRGREGFILDLAGLIWYLSEEKKEHMIIPLLGNI